MFSGFIAFLQMIWPFFKESIFGNESAAQWLKTNRLTCVWIFLMIVMLSTMFYMIDLTVSMRKHEVLAKKAYHSLQEKMQRQQESGQAMEHTLLVAQTVASSLQVEKDMLSEKLKDSQNLTARYLRWLNRCGVDLSHLDKAPPRCPSERHRVNPPKKNPPLNHNQDIIDRLKSWDLNHKKSGNKS